MNGWSIDFFIPSTGTFIQFDGVRWHGLDRTLETLEASDALVDKVILSTRKRDQTQVCWFAENKLKLVRVTDVMFKYHRSKSTLNELYYVINTSEKA